MAISNPGTVEVARGEGASLVDIARSLEPLIREHAATLEDRHIPRPLVEALYDTGVFRAMLPREVGGLEADPVEWLQLIEELARLNASVGWMAFIQSGVGLTFLDPERFERFRVRGGGRLILAMSLGRMAGTAVKVGRRYWTPPASRSACSRYGRPTRPASSTRGTGSACAARAAAISRYPTCSSRRTRSTRGFTARRATTA